MGADLFEVRTSAHSEQIDDAKLVLTQRNLHFLQQPPIFGLVFKGSFPGPRQPTLYRVYITHSKMNNLQTISIPEVVCLFPTDYSLAFLHNQQTLFTISTEERIISIQIVRLPAKQFKLRGQLYHTEMIFLVDEYLNWSMFGFSIGKAQQVSFRQRFREILSSKEIGLFDYMQELNNKDRKGMKCFINSVQFQHRFLIEFQINIHCEHLTVLELKDMDSDASFIHFCKDLTQTLSYQNLVKSKEPVIIKCWNSQPPLEGSALIKLKDFFSRYMILKEQDGLICSYSLCCLMVKADSYDLLTGKTILCNLGEQPIDLFLTQGSKSILVICLKGSIMLHELKTRVSINFPFSYTMIQQKGPNLFELIDQSRHSLVEVTVDDGPMLKTREIMKDINGYVNMVAGKNCWYLLSSEGSVYYTENKSQELQSICVLQNLTAKILSVRNIKDRFSNTLAIEKQVGSITKTQYLSNQPHIKTLLRLSHNLPCSQVDVIAISSTIVLLTNPLIGSLFLDVSFNNTQLSAKSSPDYKQFETKERTLLLKRVGESTVQVSETKIVLKQGTLLKCMESRDLFDNMPISFDHAFYLNRTVGLVIRGQIHFYGVRSQCRLESRFIFVFDEQIQYVSPINDYQLLLIKFFNDNRLCIYQVDFERQLLTLIEEVKEEYEVKVNKCYCFPVQINQIGCSIAIVTRMGEYPLLVISPNQNALKKNAEVEIVEFKALPIGHFDNLVQVTSYQNDKYSFFAKDVYLRFSKIYKVEGPASNLIVICQKILNDDTGDNSNILALTLLSQTTSIVLTQQSLILRQESFEKFSLPRELLNVEGFRVIISSEWSSKSPESNIVVTAYGKSESGNELSDENFNKAHQIKVFTSDINVQEAEFPRIIGRFLLPGISVKTIQQLKGSILLMCATDQIWLTRVLLRDNKLQLLLYSRFSYDNDDFSAFQNKLPLGDLDNLEFMSEFSKKHPIRQLSPLDLTHSFTQSRNYLLILYPKLLLILEIDCLVFKIHQALPFEEHLDSVLDNFQPGSAYLRGSNHLFVLSRNTHTGKYQVTKDELLDDTIVFASNIENWSLKARLVRISESEPMVEAKSRLIVKEFGQLEARTKDQHGQEEQSEVYL